MKKSHERLAGLTVVCAVALGMSGCDEHGAAPHTDYSARLHVVADGIISLASQKATLFEGKLPYTLGFKVPIEGGGDLSLSVRTPTAKLHPSQAEMIELQQATPDGRILDLIFYAGANGVWTTACQDSSAQPSLSEVSQQAVYDGAKLIYTDAAKAEAVLSDSITNIENTVARIHALVKSSSFPPLANICALNPGAG